MPPPAGTWWTSTVPTPSSTTPATSTPAPWRTSIWDNAEHDLERRRSDSPHRHAYDRALRILRAARAHMRGPDTVAEAIGAALTATRPRSYYRVGIDGAVVRWTSRIAPAGIRDRTARFLLDL